MNKNLNLLFGALLSFGLHSSFASAQNPQAGEQQAIISGEAALVSTYPWMGFLASDFEGSKLEQSCGLSLISPTWALTAAHCFLDDETSSKVDLQFVEFTRAVFNSDTVDPLATSGIKAEIQQVIVHENYKPDMATSENANDFDIALIELKTAVELSKVLLLDTGAPELAAGLETRVMGWGTTEVDAENMSINPSNSLLTTTQVMVGRSECATIYETGITDNMICANGPTAAPTTDTCQGDSGGPMVVASGESFVQVGVVSFGGIGGPTCGDPNAPGVYANVSGFAAWIKERVSDATFVSTLTGATAGPLGAPTVSLTISGTMLTIDWTAVANATGYTLFYAPFPSQTPIFSLDMGSQTTISGNLESGQAFYVAVQAYDASGPSPTYSNVENFTIP